MAVESTSSSPKTWISNGRPRAVDVVHDAPRVGVPVRRRRQSQRDVTEKIRRYSGPNGDFHGERVPIRDMLYYDDDTLRELYPYITIKNLIGQTKTVSTRDGFTTELGF